MTGAPPTSVAASLRIAAIRPETESEAEAGTQWLAFEGRQGGEILLHRPHEPHPRVVATDLVERPDEPGDGGLRGGRRAVTTLPARDELHPARGLLRHGDLHDLSASLRDVDVIALGQQVLGAPEQLGAVLHDPAGAGPAARLLVGGGEQDHVS